MKNIKKALSLVLIIGLTFSTPLSSFAKADKGSESSSGKSKSESSKSSDSQKEDKKTDKNSTSTQESAGETKSEKTDNIIKKEVKKDIQQLKKEAKQAYSQEEIQKIQETIAEINTKYPEIKTIPVENVISKKLNMKFDTPPVIKNGRTLIPVRAISEGLGAEVKWNAEENKVTITKDGKEIVLQLGSNIAYINGVETQLDVPAETMNNRTIVPLRFIAESLGLKVEWNQENETIEVEDEDQTIEDTTTEDSTADSQVEQPADTQDTDDQNTTIEQTTNDTQDTTAQNEQIDEIQNTETNNN